MVSCFSPDSQLPSRGLTSFLHLLLTSYQPTNVCTPCHRSLWFCCQAFTHFGSQHICIACPGWFFLQLSYVCNWFHWIILAKWQLWTNAYNWVRFRYIYPLTLSCNIVARAAVGVDAFWRNAWKAAEQQSFETEEPNNKRCSVESHLNVQYQMCSSHHCKQLLKWAVCTSKWRIGHNKKYSW